MKSVAVQQQQQQQQEQKHGGRAMQFCGQQQEPGKAAQQSNNKPISSIADQINSCDHRRPSPSQQQRTIMSNSTNGRHHDQSSHDVHCVLQPAIHGHGQCNLVHRPSSSQPPPVQIVKQQQQSSRLIITSPHSVSGCTQLSLSGSETDVSTTSTENLTCEEKYVLLNSTRQEPQGEESDLQLEQNSGATNTVVVRHLNYSSVDQSSCGTIIVHRDTDDDDDQDPDDDKDDDDDDDDDDEDDNYERKFLNSMLTKSCGRQQTLTANNSSEQVAASIDFDMSKLPPPPEYPGWLQSELQSSASAHLNQFVDEEDEERNSNKFTAVESECGGAGAGEAISAASFAGSLSRSQPDLSSLGRWDVETACNSNAAATRTYFRRTDQYPNYNRAPRAKSINKTNPTDMPTALLYQRACNSKCRSHSDLQVHDGGGDHHRNLHTLQQQQRNRGLVHHRQDSKFVEMMLAENRQLKSELESTSYKVYKLQKFEAEIQKAHQAHEELVKSSQKREELEQKVKMKFQLELMRYQETNRELKAQLDAANGQLLVRHQSLISGVEYMSLDSIRETSQREQHRDAFVAQLIQQNKELLAAKERHEIELAAQRATLCEQRTHIDILDSALTNAQANVVKLDEECRKKQAYVERVGQLQRALAALQVASERRDQMARKLRGQLEKDIQLLRQQLKQQQQQLDDQREMSSSDRLSKTLNDRRTADVDGSDLEEEEGVDDLKRMAREQEERIIALETEVSKWEQRYLEENAMRQIAIDAASMPKDAKIAALERTSQENEKLITQAHSEKLRHMDELHVANKHCADLDARVRDLESRLAERDAMIRVLQKHSIDKDTAYQNAYQLRSPRHTPHTSFHTVDHSVAGASITPKAASPPSPVPPPLEASAQSTGLPDSSVKALALSPTSISASKESLDEQLKKLDSQLLSKDSIIQALRSEKEKYPNHYWMV